MSELKNLKDLKDLAEHMGIDWTYAMTHTFTPHPHQSNQVHRVLGVVAAERESRIGKALFKDTACGVSFWVTTSVHVAGYAEGYDGELPIHTLAFPFTSHEFWAMVEEADIEGCQMWDEVNGEGDDDGEGTT